ncbi:MAG TPA: L,D-transpeptidase [Caulobacteraceae bacterium]
MTAPNARIVAVATALALLIAAPPALAQSATASASFETRVSTLKPGQFIWDDRVAPAGPVTLLVDLSTPRASAYRNGVRIGVSTISSGKKSTPTPTGVFEILQKKKDHKSNLYNSAPMPNMQRLTWDGIALHAGKLPGHPASHGCIRLPLAFSEKLFGVTEVGMTVVVANQKAVPLSVDDHAFLAPITAKGQADNVAARALAAHEDMRWTPEKAPTGPLTIVISTRSQRIVVYRNGVEIGRSRIGVKPGFDLGTRALQFKTWGPDGHAQWLYISLPGYCARKGQDVEEDALQAVAVPPAFTERLRKVIGKGTTVLATDAGIIHGETGKELMVVESGV